MSRISVCLLVDSLAHSAGTERQVIETARRLDKERFEVHVVCIEPSGPLEDLRACCRVAVFPITGVYSANGAKQIARLRRYLGRHRVDLVHAFMLRTAICAVASCLGSPRISITSRLSTGYWYTPANLLQMRVLNRLTSRVMANSEEAKRITVAEEKVDPARVDIIYQGVDMQQYRPGAGDVDASERLGIGRGKRVVGIVANLRPVKDIPLFLRSAALVAKEVPDSAFLVVGSGEQLEALKSLCKDLDLSGRVFFTEGRGRVVDYLQRMCIGCLTSFGEGFSNAILEYMAMALPVVATDVGGNREAIVHGATGYLVRERTPEALAAPVIEVLRNEELRRRMGENGRARCADKFEIGRTIRDLEQYYQRLVGPGGIRGTG